MRAAALVLVLLGTPVAMASEHYRGRRQQDPSGAHAYQRTIVNCLQAALRAGSTNPESTAASCIKAVDEIWKASFPAVCLVEVKRPPPAPTEE